MPMTLDLDTYAAEAECFVSALGRRHYLHYAGHEEKLKIEEIYEHHAGLFEPRIVAWLRDLLARAPAGDRRRRCRHLLELAVEGHIGRATRAQSAALAEHEATLEVELDGESITYRQAPIVQANEPDPERRALIERRWVETLDVELNPFHLELTERAHELAVELGWPSYRSMYEEVRGIDLEDLERQTRAFCAATRDLYRGVAGPQLVRQLGFGFDRLRRSDLSRFFRGSAYDELFPADRMVQVFERTLAGLGIDPRAQGRVKLDLERRPSKSPRAFCAPVRVPHEVYLVVPPSGGRNDYTAIFHEGGHAEHYANVDAALPFEFRHLGDNSVTEGFAFLLEHLTEDPGWVRLVLGVEDTAEYSDYVRAGKLIFLRRYAAKLAYELELHAGRRSLAEMPDLYALTLSEAVGVDWPRLMYLADVDQGYYAASYLRAWALEVRLRHLLRDRFGARWFTRNDAGSFLRSLWHQGQRLDADDLLGEVTGERLDFRVMAEDVAGTRAAASRSGSVSC